MSAAIEYATRGWHVFPIQPRGKEPLTEHGVLDATDDLEKIVEWWTQWPDANIAVATGRSGLVVIDVDPRNGGDLELWATDPAFHANTLQADTGGGGLHLFFRKPQDSPLLKAKLPRHDGVDIQRDEKYVVVAPSVHSSGGRYAWGNDKEAQPLPDWIIAAAERKPPPPPPPRDPNDDRYGTRFNEEHTWADVLEPHGWTALYYDGERTVWRRPGKDHGQSATTGYGGRDNLWVFSTSTEFDTERSYDKFGAWALLEYDGDLSAAAKDLAQQEEEVVARGAAAAAAPALESSYSWTPAVKSDHFVKRYIDYAASVTDAPLEYHEAAALSVVSTVAFGNKVVLGPYPEGLGLNLYLVLVGPSTRSRKSTSQALAVDLIRSVRKDAILPDQETPEAMLARLANGSGQPAIWTPDELGVRLGVIYSGGYMQGLEELLLSLYASRTYVYSTKGGGESTIRDVDLGVLGAATPESLAMAGRRAQLGGLIVRFGAVFPGALPDARPLAATPSTTKREALAKELYDIHDKAQSPGGPREIRIGSDALALLNAAEVELADSLATARLPVMLYKVAGTLAIADMRYYITVEDADHAIGIVARWAEGAKRLTPYLRRRGTALEFDRLVEDAVEYIQDNGGEVFRSHLSRALRLDANTAKRLRDTLIEWGLVTLGTKDEKEVWTATGGTNEGA